MGPAQIGAGHAENPYERPTDAACPQCGRPFSEHVLERQAGPTTASRLYCPAA